MRSPSQIAEKPQRFGKVARRLTQIIGPAWLQQKHELPLSSRFETPFICGNLSKSAGNTSQLAPLFKQIISEEFR